MSTPYVKAGPVVRSHQHPLIQALLRLVQFIRTRPALKVLTLMAYLFSVVWAALTQMRTASYTCTCQADIYCCHKDCTLPPKISDGKNSSLVNIRKFQEKYTEINTLRASTWQHNTCHALNGLMTFGATIKFQQCKLEHLLHTSTSIPARIQHYRLCKQNTPARQCHIGPITHYDTLTTIWSLLSPLALTQLFIWMHCLSVGSTQACLIS